MYQETKSILVSVMVTETANMGDVSEVLKQTEVFSESGSLKPDEYL